MAKKKSAKRRKSSVSFEEALEKLQTIVGELEQGSLSLDASLKKYEEGVKHLHSCYGALQEAQKKIEVLVSLDEEGKLKTVPFDDAATEFADRMANAADEELEDDEDVDDPNVLF